MGSLNRKLSLVGKLLNLPTGDNVGQRTDEAAGSHPQDSLVGIGRIGFARGIVEDDVEYGSDYEDTDGYGWDDGDDGNDRSGSNLDAGGTFAGSDDRLMQVKPGIFQWKGRHCKCFHAEPDRYCAVVEFLQLQWIAEESMLGCLRHKRLLPFAEAKGHFSTKAANGHAVLSRLVDLTIEDIFEHVRDVYHIPSDQTDDAVDLTRERASPLTVLPPPQKSIQCQSCGGWFKYVTEIQRRPIDNIMRHYTRSSCIKPPDGTHLRIRLTQPIRGSASNERSRIPIAVETGKVAETAELPLPRRLRKGEMSGIGAVPTYIEVLGWDQILTSLQANASDLLSLVLPPIRPHSSMHSMERHLEIMLKIIDQFTAEYLLAACHYAHHGHFHVADSLTEESRSATNTFIFPHNIN